MRTFLFLVATASALLGAAEPASKNVPANARFPFVIPGDDATATATSLAGLSPRAAGADGFVRIADGHFATDRGRIRFWGVNTCFAANFPRSEEAEKVAAHLAKLGFNAVRIHHHDTQPSPRGVWGPVVAGERTLDPVMMEKLDYFIAQLNRRGLYVNLNLHVGRELREQEGFSRLDLPYAARYDKYLLYFEPRLREALKDFCREYLTHFNKHRKLRRVDDPGIAMIEITNENSFSRDGAKLAASLPAPLRDEFSRQWNAWLAKRYGTTAALRKAWQGDSQPLGTVLADGSAWTQGPGSWKLHQTAGFPYTVKYGAASPAPTQPAVAFAIQKASAEVMQHEFLCDGLLLAPNKLYTIEYWIRADATRSVHVDVSNAGPANWNNIGYQETLEIGPKWKQVRKVFQAAPSIPGKARVCFKFGGNATGWSLAGLKLQEGGELVVVPAGQSLEKRTVGIPVDGWARVALSDVRRFMADVETEFIRDMMQFLKKDLGVKVPITASQITYHGEDIVAATCDYVDIHSYWQHPSFPGKPWDPSNWRITNTPMELNPGSDALLSRAPWRLHDRPFTISEWNIPDPHDYAASTVPFAALVASLQDWDGVFFFQYSNGGAEWFSDKINGFFSFNMQPAKLALLNAAAHLYRRGDLAPLETRATSRIGQRLPGTLGLSHSVGQSATPDAKLPAPPKNPKLLAASDGRAVWDATDAKRAHVVIRAPATRGVWGLVGGQSFDLGGVGVKLGSVERNYAAVFATSLDAKPLEQSKRILLTAVGSAENVDMKWNAARNSVSRDWGKGPAQVNGIPAEIAWPTRLRRVQALDGRGNPIGDVPLGGGEARNAFSIGPEHRTLWYLITAE